MSKQTTPALGISKLNQDEDLEIYRLNCRCTDGRCDQTLVLEKSHASGIIIDYFLTICHTCYISPANIWQRVKIAILVLLTGTYKQEADIVLHTEQLISLADVINKFIGDDENVKHLRSQ